MSTPGATPPTPEQLMRRARVRAWVERNWYLLGKPWPGTETIPETSIEANDSESQATKQEVQ